MNKTKYLLSIVIILVAHLVGCGGDKQVLEEADSEPINESLVGSWEVVSIDGESIEEYLDPPGEEIKIEIVKNEFVFASEGWFAENIGVEFVADLGDGISITLSIIASIKGKYTMSEKQLSLVIDEASVILDPPKVWEELGVTEEAYVQEIRKDILESGTWSANGDTLTLTSDDGEKTVLQKK